MMPEIKPFKIRDVEINPPLIVALNLPAVLLAIPLGRAINTRLDTRRFITIVHVGLFVSGAGLFLLATLK